MVTYEIAEVFPFTSDDDAAAVVELHNEVGREKIPYRHDNTVDEYRGKNNYPELDLRHFVVRGADGRLAGLLISGVWTDGSNEHLVWVQIAVRREARRKGIARAFLAKAVEIAKDADCTLVTFDTISTVPAGEAFADAIGAEVGIREVVNTVATADIDTSMLEGWRAAGPGRAPGYDVLVWDDPYPTEFHEDVARLFVMGDEDMPFEDLEMDPTPATAETVAERIESMRDVIEWTTAVARHTESGRLVGFSGIYVNKDDTQTLQTTLTVVDRDHRGFALGKWIKSAAILRAMERYPDAVRLTTENAASNAPMLGINNAIGFKKEFEAVSYQISVEALERYRTPTA